MVVNEVFYSLQGEGRLAGVPSVFVRLAGCPLRCRWCDTKYAWSPTAGTAYTPEQLRRAVAEYPTAHIVITGGEPLLAPDFKPFLRSFAHRRMHITIETAGLHFEPGLPCDLMSISPKLANSTPTDPDQAAEHEARRLNTDALQHLIEAYEYQLKFVVDAPADLGEIASVVGRLKGVDPGRIWLMPQADDAASLHERACWLADYCKQTGFALSPRLHVWLWDSRRGK